MSTVIVTAEPCHVEIIKSGEAEKMDDEGPRLRVDIQASS